VLLFFSLFVCSAAFELKKKTTPNGHTASETAGVQELELNETLCSAALDAEGVAAAFDVASQTGAVGLNGGGASLLYILNDTTLVVSPLPNAPAQPTSSFGAHVAAAHGDAFVASVSENAVYVAQHTDGSGWSHRQTLTNVCSDIAFGGALAASSTARVLVAGCSGGGATVFASMASEPTWAVAQRIVGLAAGVGELVAVSDDGNAIALASSSAVHVYAHNGTSYVAAATASLNQTIVSVAINAASGDDASNIKAFLAVLTADKTWLYSIMATDDSSSKSQESEDGDDKWNTLWIPLICGVGGGVILIAALITVVVCCCKHMKPTSPNDLLFTDIAMEDHQLRGSSS